MVVVGELSVVCLPTSMGCGFSVMAGGLQTISAKKKLDHYLHSKIIL